MRLKKKIENAVLMSVTMKNTVFCGVTLCGLAGIYKNFGGSCYLHHGRREQTQKLKAGSSRKVVNFYQATEHRTSQNNEHHIKNALYNCKNTIAKFFTQGFTVT
jgi:hypothetical protein